MLGLVIIIIFSGLLPVAAAHEHWNPDCGTLTRELQDLSQLQVGLVGLAATVSDLAPNLRTNKVTRAGENTRPLPGVEGRDSRPCRTSGR